VKLLALLVGLGIERLLTHLFHLREFRWLDPVLDFLFGRLQGREPPAVVLGLALGALALTAPVAWLSIALEPEMLHIPYFIFAVLVLLFCLGPHDLKEEVEEYCAAVDGGRSEEARRLAEQILERPPPADAVALDEAVQGAIYGQANNRIFGVVFWFVVFGPTGAWLFRIMDLMRRRAVQCYAVEAEGSTRLIAAQALHGMMAWLPARLVASGYVLAGSFDGGVSAWRYGSAHAPSSFYAATDELLARVGRGARGDAAPDPGDGPAAIAIPRRAIRLVTRTLWLIWYPVIALLTLTNWLR
jgi:membrane protein required for beta-lactamase induction